MKTKSILIVIAILVLLGFGWYSLSIRENAEVMYNQEASQNSNEVSNLNETEDIEQNESNVGLEADISLGNNSRGSYEAYSSEKLSKANSGKVVLFFRASWCPTCRALDSNIKSNLSNIPSNVTILDVDYDNSTALKQKYGVTYQHTLVQVDSSGNLISKWTGSPTLQAVVSNIK